MTEITNLEAPTGYWRTKTVALILGVNEATVRSWVRNQRLPAVKFHGVYLITEETLRDFAAAYQPEHKPWEWVEGVLQEIFPDGIELLSWPDRLKEVFPEGIVL